MCPWQALLFTSFELRVASEDRKAEGSLRLLCARPGSSPCSTPAVNTWHASTENNSYTRDGRVPWVAFQEQGDFERKMLLCPTSLVYMLLPEASPMNPFSSELEPNPAAARNQRSVLLASTRDLSEGGTKWLPNCKSCWLPSYQHSAPPQYAPGPCLSWLGLVNHLRSANPGGGLSVRGGHRGQTAHTDRPGAPCKQSQAWPLLQSAATAGRSRQLRLPELSAEHILALSVYSQANPRRELFKSNRDDVPHVPEQAAAVSCWWRSCGPPSACPSPRTRHSITRSGAARGSAKPHPQPKLLRLPACSKLQLSPRITGGRCWGPSPFSLSVLGCFTVFVLNAACLQALNKTSESCIKIVYTNYRENP